MATEVFLFGDFHPLPVEVGPYTLLDRIGAGGMAEVFLAELKGPEGFAKSLVLKRLLPEHKGVAELERMFLREARLAALLDHPGLMQTYELADIEGELFMVMEHVAGMDLSRLARAAKAAATRIPFDVLAGAVADIALGLHHMHTLVAADGAASTVIHRDVSPDNIVLAHTGAAKLIDFGIAKSVRAEQLTTVGELKGKLKFMPPEQLRGQKLGPPADMFSLGVTLYRLLTGKHPFDGSGQLDVVEKILSKRPRPPRTVDATVPDDLAELAMALVEKDANDRPRADEVYGRIVESWPRDLRASAAFLARMRPARPGSSPTLMAPGTPGTAARTAEPGSITADERLDDESEVPTSARGAVASAYREILSMRDDAVIAVAPEGTRVITIAARPDVHDRDTRVVSVTSTRTATRADPGARARRRLANDADLPTVKRIEPPAFTPPPSLPRAQQQRSSRAHILVAALALAALGAVFTAVLVQTRQTSDDPPRVASRAPVIDAPRVDAPPPLPVVEAPPAVVDVVPPDAGQASDVVVEVARPPADTRPKRTVRVELRGPASVEWKSGGTSLGKGSALASLPADARDVTAIDARNGGRVRVPVVDGVADFARVEKGTLHVLVHPFGKVSIGPKSLGESPVEPVQLPVGRYRVRVVIDGAPLERDVDVTAGTQQVKFRPE